jgi:hypothetical protein
LATGDGTLVFTDDSGVVQASFTPETLLDYITQHDAWSDDIPSWADGGRIGNLENFIESSPPTLAQRLAEWAQERLDDSSPSLDLTGSTATEAYRQEKNGLVFLLVDLRLRTHPSGLHHLILGVYDPQTDEFSQDVYDVGGDDGLYALWQEGNNLYVFCANSVTYQGIETSTNPLFLHWDGQTLEPIFNLPAAAYQSGPLSPDDPQSGIILYGEMDNDEIVRLAHDFWFTHKAVPVVGGFDLYESSPDWMPYSDEQPSQWNYLGRVALTDAVLDASTSSTNVLPERTF